MIDVIHLEKDQGFCFSPPAEYKYLSGNPVAIVSMLWRSSRHLLGKKGPGPLQGQLAI